MTCETSITASAAWGITIAYEKLNVAQGSLEPLWHTLERAQ
jgi:hypothetical protein